MKKKIWETYKQLKLTQEKIENLERTKRLNLSSKSSKQRKVQDQTILMVNFDKHLEKKVVNTNLSQTPMKNREWWNVF